MSPVTIYMSPGPATCQLFYFFLFPLLTFKNAPKLELMRRVRESIVKDAFPQFLQVSRTISLLEKYNLKTNTEKKRKEIHMLQDFFQRMFPGGDPPSWAREALESVGVTLH